MESMSEMFWKSKFWFLFTLNYIGNFWNLPFPNLILQNIFGYIVINSVFKYYMSQKEIVLFWHKTLNMFIKAACYVCEPI